ncbi:hypothetical protein EVAR_37602_1 [Eumeta japonica]|uniref:Uncharacterized protein n=1 Tax=Eumeta variegata TaxID=151549 RepID=A0A4C1VND7_EUMVA|nr:hypothetical protein EVAR_37602_1 [Eumeta japonica]
MRSTSPLSPNLFAAVNSAPVTARGCFSDVHETVLSATGTRTIYVHRRITSHCFALKNKNKSDKREGDSRAVRPARLRDCATVKDGRRRPARKIYDTSAPETTAKSSVSAGPPYAPFGAGRAHRHTVFFTTATCSGVRYPSILSNQCSIRWTRIRSGRTDPRVSAGCTRMLLHVADKRLPTAVCVYRSDSYFSRVERRPCVTRASTLGPTPDFVHDPGS